MLRGCRRLVVAVSILALSIAAGCGGGGGGSEDTTAAWASGFCSSITTWANTLQTTVNSLTNANLTKDAVSTAIDDVKGATDTLKSDLADLGKPDTPDGQKAQDSVTTLSSELESDVEKIRTAFKGASSLSELLAAAATATPTLATMKNQIRTTYNTLQGLDPAGELKTALKSSQECQQLEQQFGQSGS